MMNRRLAQINKQFTSIPTALTDDDLSNKFKNILVSVLEKSSIMMIQLNRPKQLNALSDGLYKEVLESIALADKDPHVKCIVLTGSEKAFAAGADIKEMKDMTFSTAYMSNMHLERQSLSLSRKPVIAAVNGYCLGGGCELAMMCDIMIAGENAKFGQPEINLGILPGNGGT